MNDTIVGERSSSVHSLLYVHPKFLMLISQDAVMGCESSRRLSCLDVAHLALLSPPRATCIVAGGGGVPEGAPPNPVATGEGTATMDVQSGCRGAARERDAGGRRGARKRADPSAAGAGPVAAIRPGSDMAATGAGHRPLDGSPDGSGAEAEPVRGAGRHGPDRQGAGDAPRAWRSIMPPP